MPVSALQHLLTPLAVDCRYMREAVQIAQEAHRQASPNPTVGAVLVKDGVIVARGVTEPFGGRHAEVVCIDSAVQAGYDTAELELYVTLEPCGHHGRTPPCSHAIHTAGIRKVRYGTVDIHPAVSGTGIRYLKETGTDICITEDAVARQACEALHRPFAHRVQTGRPYVVLKSAASLDGSMSCHNGDSNWITSEPSRRLVHAVRREVTAIVTGAGTIRQDDPAFTVRHVESSRHPQVYVCAGEHPVQAERQVFQPVEGRVDTIVLKPHEHQGDPAAILKRLREDAHQLILVEAGPRLSRSFLMSGLVDEWWHFIAPKWIGGRQLLELRRDAISQATCFLQMMYHGASGDDVLFVGRPEVN